MAIDPKLVIRDMYPGDVGPRDRRVVYDGWTYYLRASQRLSTLDAVAYKSGVTGFLTLDALLAIRHAIGDRVARNNPWSIRIVRFGDISGWNERTPRVIHSETLPDGEEPDGRLEELRSAVECGTYAS